jgi:hypothetical protein
MNRHRMSALHLEFDHELIPPDDVILLSCRLFCGILSRRMKPLLSNLQATTRPATGETSPPAAASIATTAFGCAFHILHPQNSASASSLSTNFALAAYPKRLMAYLPSCRVNRRGGFAFHFPFAAIGCSGSPATLLQQ